eukprot:10773824-Lingulodinium_polyedra.AAC.1
MDINRAGISCVSDTPMSSKTPDLLHNVPEKSDTVIPLTACMLILANSFALPPTSIHNCLNKLSREPAAH